jgi:hypothetical protein
VTYQSGQLTGQATTNNAGAFSIPVTGATNFANGLISLAADSPNCVDALTRLPPPFSLGALVPASKGEPPFSTVLLEHFDNIIGQSSFHGLWRAPANTSLFGRTLRCRCCMSVLQGDELTSLQSSTLAVWPVLVGGLQHLPSPCARAYRKYPTCKVLSYNSPKCLQPSLIFSMKGKGTSLNVWYVAPQAATRRRRHSTR